jgi:ABC-2 type transport system permease protein
MKSPLLALVRKDFELQKPAVPSYIISPIIFLAMFIAMDNLGGIAFILSFQILFTFTLTSFGYEEKNNSYRMLLTLPLRRKDLVEGRYVSLFLVALLLIPLIILIQQGIIHLINLTNINAELEGMGWPSAVYGVSTVLLAMSILLPTIFRVGSTKANGYVRILFILVIVGTLAIGVVIEWLLEAAAPQVSGTIMGVFFTLDNGILPVISLVLATLVFYLSSKVAARQFEKRDLYEDA